MPISYCGLWKRTLLENNQGKDSDSLVLWMQTNKLHADIRVPATRPDFTGYTRLEECSIDDLRWLATQQGFYGVTEVRDDICQWHRKHDYQPKNGKNDIGKISFTAENEMLETGVEEAYLEVWHKVEGSSVNLSAHDVTSLNRYGEKVSAYLLNVDNQVAFVRPRTKIVPDAKSLLAAIDQFKPNHETLLDWLDFEISFGEKVDDEYWQIKHSTHPFREGHLMKQVDHYA